MAIAFVAVAARSLTKEPTMSKGMDKKKEAKKKPLHTLEEKRALKREKKRQKGLL
jgi:hypothetical protein